MYIKNVMHNIVRSCATINKCGVVARVERVVEARRVALRAIRLDVGTDEYRGSYRSSGHQFRDRTHNILILKLEKESNICCFIIFSGRTLNAHV